MPSTPSATVLERDPNHWPRRLMVIMHADMVGYSRLIGRDDLALSSACAGFAAIS